MKLHAAMTLAERIQRELAPFCEPGRCEIAGSIRRSRPEVADIDLVCIPRPGQLDALKARCKTRCRVVTDGRQNFIAEMRIGTGRNELPFQIDIFLAHPGAADLLEPRPSNWGSLLLCRTGSREFNIAIANRAQRLGLAWKPYEGLFGPQDEREIDQQQYSRWVAGETEEQIFTALGLKWLAPAYRTAEPTFEFLSQPAPSVLPLKS